MKIAVVGSGIAGLTAAWALSPAHEVTLFDRTARPGMDAHGLDLGGDRSGHQEAARIDVPLRVFFDGFYPNLTALYRTLGIESEPINYSASFGRLGCPSFFRYDNYRLGQRSVPFLTGRELFKPSALRIGWELLRFFRQLPKALRDGIADDMTLEAYVDRNGYSASFCEGFLYPAFSGICTCSDAAIRAYPARVVLEYLDSGLLLSAVRRVTQGTQEVVQRLAADVRNLRLDTEVIDVVAKENGAEVVTAHDRSTFDHVVLACQANQSVKLLKSATRDERRMLESFAYENSRVVVHRDVRLCPPGGERYWSPVNFVLSEARKAPMATIWLNAIQALPTSEPIFQTWNPILEPEPELLLAESHFQRPVVNAESLDGLKKLEQLHAQPDRRIWFCGSYAAHGIPLLESAARSATAIAERLGGRQGETA